MQRPENSSLNALVCVFLFVASVGNAQAPPRPAEVINHVGAATVLVLSGEGAGRLTSISTGIVVRSGGVFLTAYHAIKNAREVQVRLNTGEIYDQAVVIGVDERRDVAAVKISATNLPTLAAGSSKELKSGEPVYVVSSSNGLAWSASTGIFAASRLADEVPGAGQGFRLLQFTAPISGGASGGPLVDARGALIGIITRGGPPGAGFAIPIESVLALADGSMNLALGTGAALKLPANANSPSSTAVTSANPQEILRAAKTLYITTKTSYFTPARLQREFIQQKDFQTLGLSIVNDQRVADLLITVDRPLFTYTFTYSVTDSRTSLVLTAGKFTAIDGNAAAGKIAKALVTNWHKVRQSPPPSQSN